jgi:AcrR family transcriptional regulator
MARPRTITDAEILEIARKLFRAHGHAASTRMIAESAGISEGVLYQRFGNKDDLFFAAMAPAAPDLELVLGPPEPTGDPWPYLRDVIARMGDYFGEVLPLALRVITHPSFDRGTLAHAQGARARLREGLEQRLVWFAKQKKIRRSAAGPAADAIVCFAHDWALGHAMAQRGGPKSSAELQAMVDVLWRGMEPTRGTGR